MKKNKLVLCVIIYLITLSGCSDNTDVNHKVFRVEDHLLDQSKNLKVDADVYIPDAAKTGFAPCGRGVAHGFSKELEVIKENVVGGKKLLRSEEGLWEYEGGFFVSTVPGEIFCSGKSGEDMASCLQLDKNSELYTEDLFEKNGELSFKSYKDVYKAVTKFYNELNIEVAKDYTCYAMNYKNMIKANQMFANSGDQMVRTDWKEREDCYYFRFRPAYKGIPMISKGDTYMGTFTGDSNNVIYSKDGIQRLVISEYYDLQESEMVSLVSASDALETLKVKYRDLIVDEAINVKYIELCLFAETIRLEEEVAEIYPVWSFQVEEIPGEASSRVLINAQTGQEVIIAN